MAAVMEKQGKSLTVHEPERLDELLSGLMQGLKERRLYPTKNRIVIKQYPKEAADALKRAGFRKEMQDYVFYR